MIVYSKTNHIMLRKVVCRSSSNVNISVRTVSATVTWWKCKAAVVSHSRCQCKPTDRKKTVQNKSSRKVFVDLQKVLYQKAHKHRLNNNLSTRAKLSLHPSSNLSQTKRYKRQQYANSSGYFRANTLSIIVLVQREPHHYTKMTVWIIKI